MSPIASAVMIGTGPLAPPPGGSAQEVVRRLRGERDETQRPSDCGGLGIFPCRPNGPRISCSDCSAWTQSDVP